MWKQTTFLSETPEFLSVKVQNLDYLEHGEMLKELEGMYKKDLLRNEGQPRYNILDSRGEPNFDVTFGFYGEGRWIFVIDPEEDNPICRKFTWGAIGETHFLLRSSYPVFCIFSIYLNLRPIELDLSNDSASIIIYFYHSDLKPFLFLILTCGCGVKFMGTF